MIKYSIIVLKFQNDKILGLFLLKKINLKGKMQKNIRGRMAQAQKVARSEFSGAIAQIAAERKIAPEAIYEAIEAGLLSAYRKQMSGEYEDEAELDSDYHYFAKVEQASGAMNVYRAPIIGEIDEEDENAVVRYDEKKLEDVTPAGFGRIAAQVAKQVIIQRVRDAERDQIINDYADKIGVMVTAQVLRMEKGNVLLDIGRGNAYMPPKEQMRGEFYKNNARIAVYIKGIEELNHHKAIIVSRADGELVRKLFEREVPEINAGTVEIKLLAREAGVRTKVAVVSNGGAGIDPVGSCVGQRGVRVQEIIKELNNEKIDIINYYQEMDKMIASALAPAENLKIEYDEEKKTAEVTAPDDQVSLTIGRGGQNVRLAAKLLGVSITVKSESGAVTTKMTGNEEYEIDSYGLSEETRNELINLKLVTYADITRFSKRIEENDKIEEAEKERIFAQAKMRQAADEETKAETKND